MSGKYTHRKMAEPAILGSAYRLFFIWLTFC